MRESVVVILPVHNGQNFLAQAIDSVLAQTRQPDELLMWDDGSTDGNAGALIARKRGVTVLGTAKRYGQAHALNLGIMSTKSDFLTFLDHDDVWLADKLALQLAAFAEDPKLQAVTGHAEQFYEGSSRRAAPLPARLTTGMMIRRSAMELVGRFRPELGHGAQLEWFARAESMGLGLRVLPQTLYRRRVHGENSTIVDSCRDGYMAAIREIRKAKAGA